MNLTFFPALSDRLRQMNIDPLRLLEALEAYQEDITAFINLNFNQYEKPLEYLDVTDKQAIVKAFVEMVPRLCPESKDCIAIESGDEFDADFDEDDQFDD